MKANGFVFVSGQMPATFDDGKVTLVQGTVAEKTHSMCRNAAAILEAAGSSLDKVVKVTVSAYEESPSITRVMKTSPLMQAPVSVYHRSSSATWMTPRS